MGTRSTVTFYDHGQPLITIYTQFDGYIGGGVGNQLGEFLNGLRVVNGFGPDDKAGEVANGMRCLAAQWIAEVKDSVGNVYINQLGKTDEEFNYHVRIDKDGEKIIMIENYGEKAFMTAEQLAEYDDTFLDEAISDYPISLEELFDEEKRKQITESS